MSDYKGTGTMGTGSPFPDPVTDYAMKKAHEAQNRWLNGSGGHAHALAAVHVTICQVIEDCARIADERCHAKVCHQDTAARIRSLLSPDTKGQP